MKRNLGEIMRKFTRLQKILSILICISLIFSFIMLSLRQNSLSNLGYSAWTYIKYGLIDYPLKSLGNGISDFANLWHVYEDNEYLKEELAQQRSYKTLYEEERNKNEDLEKLLDIKNSLPDALTISCSVVSRSASSWKQTVTISAGKVQGVKPNMIVMTSEGAIGLIEEVQSATSTVRLLTSEDLVNDIAIKISLEDGSSVEGVLQSYDAKKGAYCVSLFDNDATVSAGQSVATSGSGGNYPSGLFVGTVVDVSKSDDAIISTVYVSPVSNMKSFEYVLVIGNEGCYESKILLCLSVFNGFSGWNYCISFSSGLSVYFNFFCPSFMHSGFIFKRLEKGIYGSYADGISIWNSIRCLFFELFFLSYIFISIINFFMWYISGKNG